MPCVVTTLLATTGAVRAVRDFGSFLSGVLHLSSRWLTFSEVNIDSSNAHPVRCGSCPKVGQSGPLRALAVRQENRLKIMVNDAFQGAFIESPLIATSQT
jgi:hypothetical protein